MKIAVASDDQINVCGHVGKAKGFLIFEVESGKIKSKEYRENKFTNHFNKGIEQKHSHEHAKGHGHGDGHKELVDGLSDCDYLISHGMGRKLVEDFMQNGIKTLVTVELNAEKAAVNLEVGRLKSDDNLICG